MLSQGQAQNFTQKKQRLLSNKVYSLRQQKIFPTEPLFLWVKECFGTAAKHFFTASYPFCRPTNSWVDRVKV